MAPSSYEEENAPLDEYYERSSHNHRRWYYAGGAAVVVAIGVVVGAVVASYGGGGGSSVASPSSAATGNNGGAPTPAPTTGIQNIIQQKALFGGTEFDDPTSYQSTALWWLQGSPNTFSDERLIQRYALACIYEATNGVATPWTDFTFGPTGTVLRWLDERGWLEDDDECTWEGVLCNDQKVVVELDLSSNLLTGSMPPETSMLSSLRRLDIYNNLVYNVGDAGNNWLGEMVSLEQLYMGQTSFQYDGIPPAIGNLVNLVEFDCSYTLYFGPLRGEVFENLNKLEYLYIGGNSFNSSIPSEITNLPNLVFFYAEYSDIIGNLDFMIGMPKIFELWMDKNPGLTGQIPTQIGELLTLESFSVTGCGLSGPIPTEIGNLVNMQQMWFYDNNLQLAIPSQIGNLQALTRLELEKNALTGIMPEEICNNVYPRGLMRKLEADCDGEIFCPDDCCTCCGEACVTEGDRGSANRRRLNFLQSM